jgi:hypothetical protein
MYVLLAHTFDTCMYTPPGDLAAAKMSDKRPSFVAYPLYLPHLRRQVEDTVNIFNPSWLLPP